MEVIIWKEPERENPNCSNLCIPNELPFHSAIVLYDKNIQNVLFC